MANADPADPTAPARIGPYAIVRPIAHGGMGAVYLARRDNDFDRLVALKVVKRGMDSDAIVRRFRIERQILARFDHEGIARLLDGGTTDEGRPYLVMEYIEGEPITTYCSVRGVRVRERLRLFMAVCAAVQYAHQLLVIHRDLKPGNILVTTDGRPKLLDFGVAKILNPEPTAEEAGLTATVMRVLTPEYASPEQVRGDLVGTASDVYALGVLLYELLTGNRPYRVDAPTREAIARAVCDQEPARPSTVAAAADLRRELDRDLDAIVLKALEKDPSRRYASAAALADDLGRHLDGVPIQARHVSTLARGAKFARRHRLGTAAALAVLLSLGGGVMATAWQTRVAGAERARAEIEAGRARRGFQDVRKLAVSFLFEIHDAIWNLEGALPARELVVRRGLESLEDLAREAGDDPGLRLELARAYVRLGQVQGDFYWATNLREYRHALETFQRGNALLETPADWPATLRAERAGARAELYSYEAKTQGVIGDVAGGIEAIRQAQRWHRIQTEEYRALHPGGNPPSFFSELYLNEADLWLRAGNLTANLRTLDKMRDAIGSWDDPAVNPLGKGTYYSRVGHAQHVLAVSMGSRLADPVAARALLEAALASQQRGYDHRKRAWDGEPDSYPFRSLTAQCLLFMGNAAFGLSRTADGQRWTDEGIRLTTPGPISAWGHQWRGRLMVAKGSGAGALPHLAAARDIEAKESRDDAPSTRLAAIHQDIGDAQWLAGNRVAFEQAYRAALGTWERLTRENPTYGEHAENLVCAVTRFASRLVEAGRPEEARRETERVLRLLREQADAPTPPASRQSELAWLLLTAQPTGLRDSNAALVYAGRAVAAPEGKHPDALAILAVAQFLGGRTEEAIATALEAYDLLPQMRAGRDNATLRRDIRENFTRHPLQPPAQPLWF